MLLLFFSVLTKKKKDIAQHLHSCQFGTFLGDTAEERHTLWESCTESFWSMVNSSQHLYVKSSFSHDYASCPVWVGSGNHTNRSGSAEDRLHAQQLQQQQQQQRKAAELTSSIEWRCQTNQLRICRDLHIYY